MNLRPTIRYDDPPLENPLEELPSAIFHHLSGFWPMQFEEIVHNLALIPDQVVCPTTRCRSSKHRAKFILFRRWKKADTWEYVAHGIHHHQVWCIEIYRAVFELLALHYRKLVQVIDYCRIIPLLDGWSDDMVHFSGYLQDVLFFTDGTP
jgi:hypothetical protein